MKRKLEIKLALEENDDTNRWMTLFVQHMFFETIELPMDLRSNVISELLKIEHKKSNERNDNFKC